MALGSPIDDPPQDISMGHNDNDLLFPTPKPLPDFLGSLAGVLGIKDALLGCILGREGREIEVGEYTALGVFELLEGVEGGIAGYSGTGQRGRAKARGRPPIRGPAEGGEKKDRDKGEEEPTVRLLAEYQAGWGACPPLPVARSIRDS